MKLREACRTLTPEVFPRRQVMQGRYRDVDVRRHINNAAVVDLFSEARFLLMDELFAMKDRPRGMFFVVGQQAAFYAGEALFPGHIEIGSGILEIGRTSARFAQAFFNNGKCTSVVEAVLVCSLRGRAVPIPPEVVENCHRLLLPEGLLPRQLISL